MPRAFAPKKYFSKIFVLSLVQKLYAKHNAEVFFDISDQTPRKTAVDMMVESFTTLDPAQRIDIEGELSYISSYSTKHTARLAKLLYKETTGKEFEPEVECTTDHDYALYFSLYHEELVEQIIFLNEFYASKSYITYEADVVDKDAIDIAIGEFTRECHRIVNKDDNASECESTHLFLNNVFYFRATFEGARALTPKIDKETGEINRAHTTRRIETVRIAYLPQEERVLIAGTISKYEKLIFLDTFLRLVCKGKGYEGKVESYDVNPFKNLSLDFLTINKGMPLLRWKIKSINLAYGEGKKKLKLTLASGPDQNGQSALEEALSDLGMREKFSSFNIDSVAFQFTFADKEKAGKSINVSCSLSRNKASLCALYEYENYGRKLLKLAEIDKGFVLEEVKKQEAKVWE